MGNLRSQAEGGVLIRSGYSHVDWRGLTKIQYLIHDVGGLEEELQLGEPGWERPSQIGDQFCGWSMPFSERNQDLAIHGSHRRGIAQGNIYAAVGESHVVEHDIDLIAPDRTADLGFNLGKVLLRLFDTGSGRCPHMQSHLTGIDLREEVAAQQGE